MESVLHLYHLPHDEKRPVICFDELPVQQIGSCQAPARCLDGGNPSLIATSRERVGQRAEGERSFWLRVSVRA